MNYKILKQAYVNQHNVTGNTVHKKNSQKLDIPYKLEIVQYKNDSGFYLLYFDCDNQEITDTYHETLSDALDQSDWEFKIKKSDWENIKDESTF